MESVIGSPPSPSEDRLTFFISQAWTRHSPVIQVSAAATWSLIAPSDKQSFPLLCFAVRMCPWFSLQLCSPSAFIVHKLINVSGFYSEWWCDQRRASGFTVDAAGGCDAAARRVSLSLTLRLCLFPRCRSVREEERPEGLWRLHLSIRRRLQRRRRSAQMCLPVPGTQHQELSFFSRFNSAVIYMFLSSAHKYLVSLFKKSRYFPAAAARWSFISNVAQRRGNSALYLDTHLSVEQVNRAAAVIAPSITLWITAEWTQVLLELTNTLRLNEHVTMF